MAVLEVAGVREGSGVQAAVPPRDGEHPPAAGQGIPGGPVRVQWLREAVCLPRGHSEWEKGEFVFQA